MIPIESTSSPGTTWSSPSCSPACRTSGTTRTWPPGSSRAGFALTTTLSGEGTKSTVAEMLRSREDISAVEVDLLVLKGRETFEILVGDGGPGAQPEASGPGRPGTLEEPHRAQLHRVAESGDLTASSIGPLEAAAGRGPAQLLATTSIGSRYFAPADTLRSTGSQCSSLSFICNNPGAASMDPRNTSSS
jgi:hypothetical protein